MKSKYQFFITVLLIVTMHSSSYAQDNTQFGLPEGAIARLGKGGINIMRFSPDGTHLAVGTDVGVWLYDVPDGKETALFTGQKGQVNALAFSPDGKTIASGGFSNPIIQLWDVETARKLSFIKINRRISELNVDNSSVSVLEFTKEGNTLISLSTYRTIEHWDIETGNRLDRLGHLDSSKSVVYSNTYNGFATGNRVGGINLWDAIGKSRVRLRGHSNLLKKEDRDVWALAFSPDGNILASGSEDETVGLWDTENGKNIAKLENHSSRVTAVAFSYDGKILASGDQDAVIKLWDIETQREFATLIGHTNGICTLTFSPDGRTLASGSYDGTIRFWNQDTGQPISTFATGFTEAIMATVFTQDSTLLVSASIDGTVDVWSLKTRGELTSWTSGDNNMLNVITFSHDGTVLAAHSSNWTIVYDPLGFGFSGGGEIVSKGIKVRNIITDQRVQGPWEEGADFVNGLALSPNKKMLTVSINWQGIICWDMKTGKEKFRFNDKSPFEKKLVYSHNGDLLASYGHHAETKIWHVNSQEERTPSDLNRISALAFSSDDKLLATGGGGGIVLWDVSPTKITQHGKIGDSRIGDYLTFSPDRGVLLNAKIVGWDYVIQLWDVNTGWDLGTLTGHTEKITSLKFSKDGKTLASGSYDGTILLWDWDKIIAKARNDITGKNLSNNIIPPIQYASKAEDAEAILNWLEKHNYQVKKLGEKISITQGKSRTLILGSGGGTISTGDLNFTLIRTGTFQIGVKNVGTAVFTFDEKGDLKHNNNADENHSSQKEVDP